MSMRERQGQGIVRAWQMRQAQENSCVTLRYLHIDFWADVIAELIIEIFVCLHLRVRAEV